MGLCGTDPFLSFFELCPGWGVLVGQRLGENRPDLALRSTWTGLRITLLYQAAMAFVYLSLPGTLALVFRRADDAHWEEVAALVPFLLRFVAFYSFFDGANLVFSSVLRGADAVHLGHGRVHRDPLQALHDRRAPARPGPPRPAAVPAPDRREGFADAGRHGRGVLPGPAHVGF